MPVSPVLRIVSWILLPAFATLAADGQPAAPPAKAPAVKPEDEAFLFTPAGFDRAGKPLTAAGDKTGTVQLVVRDAATGKPTFCRVNVVGSDGNFYQPAENYLSRYALTGQWPKEMGNRPGKAPFRYVGRFFYSWGETTVAVPPGAVRIEVWKGLE